LSVRFRAILIALLAAPWVTHGAVSASQHPLLGTSWTVAKVQGVAVPAGLTLTFEADRVAGTTGCNQFWAPVEYLDPPAIDVGAPQSKRVYCLGAMGIERAFLASLETVETFDVEGTTLKMKMHDGDVFIELLAAR
jgi:heat shock protein HslJ